MKQIQKGLTLIELMIVVAIIGIIAAIAYPSYQTSIQNSRKSSATACLMEIAQQLERHYSANLTYVGFVLPNINNPAVIVGGCRTASNLNNFYTISIANIPALTSRTYQLQAVPVAGSTQAGHVCGTLTLNEQGVRGPNTPGCW